MRKYGNCRPRRLTELGGSRARGETRGIQEPGQAKACPHTTAIEAVILQPGVSRPIAWQGDPGTLSVGHFPDNTEASAKRVGYFRNESNL